MAPGGPRSFGPGVRLALDDLGIDPADLVAIGDDRGVALLRAPASPIAVLHQSAPDTDALLDEADRLLWLTGVDPAPEMIASARADDGGEAVVIRLGHDATTAADGHPMGPEALVEALAGSLAALHGRPVRHCPLSADRDALRRIVDQRIERGLVAEAVDGPYAGRSAAELASIFDVLAAEMGAVDDPVFVHGGLAPSRIWLDPAGAVTFLGWQWAGVGDRHVDLAAAAALLTRLHGPALVAPFVEAYGFDRVDARRLDAHQLLAHLLS